MGSAAKLGLVLSGGGAKGAYQAGVIRYLSEIDIQPAAVAGASIGSLNGVIVAGSENIHLASERLDKIWNEISENSPLKMDKMAFSVFVLRIAAALFGGPTGRVAASQVGILEKVLPEKYQKYVSAPAILDNSPTIEIIDRCANINALGNGIPFWVSVFPSKGATKDLLGIVRASLGFGESRDSDFIKVNELSADECRKVLLASSAIPLAFEAQSINGNKYYDGGMGGWSSVQGNTPITPLLKNEGCSHVIVTHLQDGSFWDRNQFPDATILEIRPKGITRKGFLDMLTFEKGAIIEWKEQGYQDAKSCIEPVRDALATFGKRKESEEALVSASENMRSALDWLK